MKRKDFSMPLIMGVAIMFFISSCSKEEIDLGVRNSDNGCAQTQVKSEWE